MLERFQAFIRKHDLFDTRDRILLAVSGGLDSMAMLELFRSGGYNIGVAHCNFQLRGKESNEDEDFVKQTCHKLKLEFHGKCFETKNYAEKAGLSVQMAARELRYAWFEEVLTKGKYFAIATAHQLDDNLETVLMRWSRGASLELLNGIPIRNKNVVRPLLFATRKELEDFARQSKIKWQEDSSNTTDDYHRNFIRHQIVPKLKEINPSLEETFTNSLEKLKGSYELMQRGLEQLKDSATRTEGRNFLIDKSLLALMKNPAFVCYEFLRPFGFEWERCVQLTNALSAQSGKKFLSATHQAVLDRESIIVSPLEGATQDILIEEGQDKAALGDWRLRVLEQTGNKVSASRDFASIDKSKLRFPLLWRKWRNGDSFYPLGMAHSKKVSDFLVDEKVSVPDKQRVTLIESQGEVIWVVGYRVDERFKVTPQTKAVIELQVTRI